MPTYDFRCKNAECNHAFEKMLKLSEREEYPQNDNCPKCNSEIEQYVAGTCGFTTSESLGRKKAPDSFRELMRRMKKAHPGSTIKDH